MVDTEDNLQSSHKLYLQQAGKVGQEGGESGVGCALMHVYVMAILLHEYGIC